MQSPSEARRHEISLRYLSEILPAKSEWCQNPTPENAKQFIELVHPWFIDVLASYKAQKEDISRLRAENQTLEETVSQLLAQDAQNKDLLAQTETALHDLEDIGVEVQKSVQEKLNEVRISVRKELEKQYAENEQIFAEQIISLNAKITQRDSQLADTDSRYNALIAFRNELKTKNTELDGQLATARADVGRAKSEVTQLHLQIQQYEGKDAQNKLLAELMKTRSEELGKLQQMLASKEKELAIRELELKGLAQQVEPFRKVVEALGTDGLAMAMEGLPETLRGLESRIREEFLADQRQDTVQIGHQLLDPTLGGIPKGSALLVLGTQYTGMEWIAYEFAVSAMMDEAPVLYITTTMQDNVLRKNLKTVLNKKHQLSLIEKMEHGQAIEIYDANSDLVDLREISTRIKGFLSINSGKNKVPRIIIDTYRYQVRAPQEKDMPKQSESIYGLRDEVAQTGAVMLCTVGAGTYDAQTLADLRRAFACEAEFTLGEAGGKVTGKVNIMATWMEKPISSNYTKAPDGITKTALEHVK